MPTRSPSAGDMADELFTLLNGLGVLLIPLYPLALPVAVLLLVLVLPVAVLAVAATALVAPPVLAVRALSSRGARPSRDVRRPRRRRGGGGGDALA